MDLRDRLNAHFKKSAPRAPEPAPEPKETRRRLERLLRAVSGEAAAEEPAPEVSSDAGDPAAGAEREAGGGRPAHAIDEEIVGRARRTGAEDPCPDLRDPLPVERAVPGEEFPTPRGRAFRIVRRWPIDTAWGGVRFREFLDVDRAALARLGKDPRLADVPLEGFRFVDTETTGLAGGTGTYAFLVGVGEVRRDEVVLTQYLLRDFEEEGALLHALGGHFEPPAGLVSFNGKAFDLPLLETRRVMNRADGCWIELPHFDLLHPARRIWKLRLVQCALTRLEAGVLGVEREADIEGSRIPEVYFDYLRSGDARELARVVEHNRLDILSMVALLAHAVSLYGRPEEHADRLPPSDLFSLGRLHHVQGDRDRGREVMDRAVRSGLEESQEAQVLWLMAKAHRQAGEWERAVEAWERLVSLAPDDPAPYVELAKHYEHRGNRLDLALEWVARAKQSAGASGVGLAALEHREARLRKKLARAE